MRIVFAGKGPVALRCLMELKSMPVEVEFYHGPDEALLKSDFLISVHWPEKIGQDILEMPKEGALNLHNSYLPWNKGADACTWAIIDKTPHGATMHWMSEGIDDGDIFHQEKIAIADTDTTDSLYKKTADLEIQVFRKGMEILLSGDRSRFPQWHTGSRHYRKDFERLKRALTTNKHLVIEAAT